MKITYGTAGFRYNHKIIEEIAFKIGIGLVICSTYTNKRIGIMITASHNKYEDNGIKITDDKGAMIGQRLEEIMEQVVNSENNKIIDLNQNDQNIENTMVKIVIGQDTRKSGTSIKKLIINGAKSVCNNVIIVDLGKVTTPQHHYYLHNKFDNYIDKYTDIYSKLEINIPVVVDCANGVGYLTLYKILNMSNKDSFINLSNTNTKKYSQLNNKCGSDYVMNNMTNISDFGPNKLGVSFDGDADRIICYFEENNKMFLLDGDHISALILYYLIDVLKINLNINVICTGYSNGAFIDFCKGKGINTRCCPTGIKHLDKKARNGDIGLYFEYNGHGTCLFNNCTAKVNFLKQVFNQVVGDAIGTLAAILFILNETNMSLMDWHKLYDKRNCLIAKVKVKNKSIYKTDSLGTTLLQPYKIALDLKNILNGINIRWFVRPSGTENIVRIYVEGNKTDDELGQVVDEIKKILV